MTDSITFSINAIYGSIPLFLPSFCSVKTSLEPRFRNSSTILNLICASDNVYSFLLSKVTSHKTDAEVDYKVLIEPREQGLSQDASFQNPHFVRVGEVQEYKRQIQDLQSQMEASRTEAKQASERENSCYIIPKVLDRGYLQVGKKRMDFWRPGA